MSGCYHKRNVTLPSEYLQSVLENLNNVSVIQSTIFLSCKTELIYFKFWQSVCVYVCVVMTAWGGTYELIDCSFVKCVCV